MFVREQLVRPQAISKTALLTIEGELDDISGNGQTEAAHVMCTSIPVKKREHYLAPGVGHYGIFSGRRFRESLYPRIRDFIRYHGELAGSARRPGCVDLGIDHVERPLTGENAGDFLGASARHLGHRGR